MRVAVLLFLFTLTAEAQNKPRPEVRVTGGFAGFIDEDLVGHAVAGGAIRYYITPRVSIEPEV